MKIFLYIIFAFLLSSKTYGQKGPTRNMHSRLIGKDSVVVYFDEHYKIVEPNCSTIIRYSHYDTAVNRFTSTFKDILKKDTSFIVSQGSYLRTGVKNGEFITHYLNGKLLAKGLFKNGKYAGDWVFYYLNGQLKEKASFKNGQYEGNREFYNEDGSPSIFIKIKGEKCTITDVWGVGGKKIIDKGNGYYEVDQAGLKWRGKLLNGLPDGIWTFQASDAVYGSEMFDKGFFLNGSNKNTLGEQKYDDKSRIPFLPKTPKLEFSNSEYLAPDPNFSCDGVHYSGRWYWKIFE